MSHTAIFRNSLPLTGFGSPSIGLRSGEYATQGRLIRRSSLRISADPGRNGANPFNLFHRTLSSTEVRQLFPLDLEQRLVGKLPSEILKYHCIYGPLTGSSKGWIAYYRILRYRIRYRLSERFWERVYTLCRLVARTQLEAWFKLANTACIPYYFCTEALDYKVLDSLAMEVLELCAVDYRLAKETLRVSLTDPTVECGFATYHRSWLRVPLHRRSLRIWRTRNKDISTFLKHQWLFDRDRKVPTRKVRPPTPPVIPGDELPLWKLQALELQFMQEPEVEEKQAPTPPQKPISVVTLPAPRPVAGPAPGSAAGPSRRVVHPVGHFPVHGREVPTIYDGTWRSYPRKFLPNKDFQVEGHGVLKAHFEMWKYYLVLDGRCFVFNTMDTGVDYPKSTFYGVLPP